MVRRAALVMSVVVAGVVAAGGIALSAPSVLDPTFDGDGKVATGFGGGDAQAVALQPDGKIVVAGQIKAGSELRETDIGLLRYNVDGSLDATFDGDGAMNFSFNTGQDGDSVGDIVVSDGKIIVVGSSSATGSPIQDQFAVARLGSNGALDVSFGGGDGKLTTAFVADKSANAYGVAVQEDGKIVVAGDAHTGADSNGVSNFAVARYNNDGTLDDSFAANGKQMTGFGPCPSQTWARDVAIQPDGKLVVVGAQMNWRAQCVTPNNAPEGMNMGMVRYHPNGSIDYGFGDGGVVMTPFSGPDGAAVAAEAWAVQILSDRKILVGGAGQGFQLARYDEDGTLDTSFDGDGRKSMVFRKADDGHTFGGMGITPGGRILLAGTHRPFHDPEPLDYSAALVRLNPDGSFDRRFSEDGMHTEVIEAGSDTEVRGLAIQPDGRFVVAGRHRKDDAATGTSSRFFALMRFKGGGEGLAGDLYMTGSIPTPNGSLKVKKDVVVTFSAPLDRDTIKQATASSTATPDATDYTVGLFLERKDKRGHIYYTRVPATLKYDPADPNSLIVDPSRLLPNKRYILLLHGGDNGLMDDRGATLIDDLPLFFQGKR